MLDAFTSSMCVESWGRISFARALIEIDAAVGLKKEVSMAIPAVEGDNHIKEDDGFKEVKSRKKKKGADSRSFGGLRLNKPNSKVIWQEKKSRDTTGRTQPSVSIYNNDNGVSNLGLTTANPFDVLNGNGDDMGESETQPKVSDHVNLVLNKIKDASKPSSSNSGYGDVSTSVGGGNQLEDEDFDVYDGYEDQVVDLHGALKEYRDFMLSMSGKK
nr:hypothetical protein [Tanacetum cinerariifolium]